MRSTRRSERRERAGARERKPTVREKLADSIEVSKELTLDATKVTMFGTREITVENYSGVIEYTDSLIALSAKPRTIRISGANLEIKTMSREIIYATGAVHKIEYV